MGRLGHATVHLELLMEGSQLPSDLRRFPFLLCLDFSEKGNEELSVPYTPGSLRYRSRSQREVGDQITLGFGCCVEKGNCFACHHPGAKAVLARIPGLPWTCSLPCHKDGARGKGVVRKA